jgi:hypothetical protein
MPIRQLLRLKAAPAGRFCQPLKLKEIAARQTRGDWAV